MTYLFLGQTDLETKSSTYARRGLLGLLAPPSYCQKRDTLTTLLGVGSHPVGGAGIISRSTEGPRSTRRLPSARMPIGRPSSS